LACAGRSRPCGGESATGRRSEGGGAAVGEQPDKHEPDRLDLIKAYAIEAFDRTFDRSKNQRANLRFAEGMRGSKSPQAKKAAGQFLRKHGNE
jgi:hypothetical protein